MIAARMRSRAASSLGTTLRSAGRCDGDATSALTCGMTDDVGLAASWGECAQQFLRLTAADAADAVPTRANQEYRGAALHVRKDAKVNQTRYTQSGNGCNLGLALSITPDGAFTCS